MDRPRAYISTASRSNSSLFPLSAARISDCQPSRPRTCGTPYSITGTNNELNCPGCGSVFVDVNADPEPTGRVGSSTEPYYPVNIFSQPSGISVAGFGNSGRNRFRRPPVTNLDLSLFKQFEVGRIRPEFRIEAVNVFNHTNWGAPVTNITANNFMLFTPGSAENGTNTPGARRIQLALRLQF